MKKIMWSPWRMEFIKKAQKFGLKGCIFCELPQKGTSPKTLVIHKGKKAFVILNKYPYNSGHLMVVPNQHVSDFTKLETDEHLELIELIKHSLDALKKLFKIQGANVGLNLGRAAGAGIEEHLHYHIVPRWVGDSNFMPAIGEIRMMPEHILATYQKLAAYFEKYDNWSA